MKRKLLIAAVVAALVSFVLFALISARSSSEILREAEAETYRLLLDMIRWAIEDDLDYAELALRQILQDEAVVRLLAARDREGLYAHLAPAYREVSRRVARFHFHLPDGASFLRVQAPERYGDELGSIRPMIARALAAREMVRGIEEGVDGFGIRVALPLLDGGAESCPWGVLPLACPAAGC